MDPPLAATFHKENLHFGGGIPTIMWKSIKANPACKEIKHELPDDGIKLFDDWSLQGMKCCSWTLEDKENFYKKQALSEKIASVTGVSVSELEQPIPSDDNGYETDPDKHSRMPFPGHLASIYTPEELAHPFGVYGIVMDDVSMPELKLKDNFGFYKDNIISEEKIEKGRAILANLKLYQERLLRAEEALKKKKQDGKYNPRLSFYNEASDDSDDSD